MTKYKFKICLIIDVEIKYWVDIYLELFTYIQTWIQELYKRDHFSNSWKSINLY